MTYLSIIEKLEILINTLLDFKIILALSILLVILTFLYTIKKLNKKKYILCMSLSFVVVFGISIISNYDILSNTFDNFTTILIGNIYFPSIYVYISVLLISFILFITSMLNVMIKKAYKVINSIMFTVNNILFLIVINIIAKNKIDIFSVNSLYSDTTLVVILELSMGLFILWMLSLIIIYITNVLCERLAYKKTYNDIEQKNTNNEVFNPVLEVSYDNEELGNTSTDTLVGETIEENIIAEQPISIEMIGNDKVEDEVVNYTETTKEYTNKFIITDTTCEDMTVYEESTKENNVFDNILNGGIPVIYYDNDVKEEEYSIIDPQKEYENKCNEEITEDIIFNGINLNNIISKPDTVYNITEDNIKEKILPTYQEKDKVENYNINTISLNDLIKDDNINTLEVSAPTSEDTYKVKDSNKGYTTQDYEKIIEMLKSLKSHTKSGNINIDDAVAISLISNYSIDDCMKFKNILENNLK